MYCDCTFKNTMTINSAVTGLPDVETIRDILRQVIDPEVGINIVDLGLVYLIEVAAEHLRIEITMTSPVCPMGEMIADEARAALAAALPDGCRPDIRLVWEPPWNPSMMSADSKRHFGWQ